MSEISPSERRREFWRTVFSEESGSPSFSRVATAFVTVVVTGLLVYIVISTKQFPEVATMAGITAFAGSLYATNRATDKLADVIAALRGIKKE